MQQTVVGGTKKKVTDMLAMAGLIIIFIAYMFRSEERRVGKECS